MNEKTSRVLLRVSTRIDIDGRVGDEVMTSVMVKKGGRTIVAYGPL